MRENIMSEIRRRLGYSCVTFSYAMLAAGIWNQLVTDGEGMIYGSFILQMYVVLLLIQVVSGVLHWFLEYGVVSVVVECVLCCVIIVGAAVEFGWIQLTGGSIALFVVLIILGEVLVCCYSQNQYNEISRKINQLLLSENTEK